MANEITLNVQGQLNNGTPPTQLKDTFMPNAIQVTQAAQEAWSTTVATSTTQALVTPALTTLGYAFFQNLDDTDAIQIGRIDSGTFRPFIYLKPGEFSGPVRLYPGIPLAADADANTPLLFVKVWND